MPNIENLVCECFSCKKEYNLNSTVLENREIIIGNEKLFLKILICPFCHAECVVQIDNEETIKLLHEQININVVLGKMAVQQKDSNRYIKQQRKLKSISQILLQARRKLVIKYNGSVYYFENENKKININEPVIHIAGNKQEEIKNG